MPFREDPESKFAYMTDALWEAPSLPTCEVLTHVHARLPSLAAFLPTFAYQ
jgi:hypothetical protein